MHLQVVPDASSYSPTSAMHGAKLRLPSLARYVKGCCAGIGKRGRGTFGIPSFSQSQIWRSEEHTSELQSLMRISYAVFCLNKKTTITTHNNNNTNHT